MLAHNIKKLIVLATFILFNRTGSAEIAVESSVEWLSNCSNDIGIYGVVNFKNERQINARCNDVIIDTEVQNVLKGSPPPKMQITDRECVKPDSSGSLIPQEIKIGDKFLLFFDEYKRLPRFINLRKPRFIRYQSAITNDLQILDEGETILKLVDEQLARLQDPSFDYGAYVSWLPEESDRQKFCNLSIELVPGGRIHKMLYGGSSVVMRVTPDPKLKQRIIKCLSFPDSECWFSQESSTAALKYFPSPETIELLKLLLNDKNSISYPSSLNVRRYPTREAAYKTLQLLGVPVENVILEEPIN